MIGKAGQKRTKNYKTNIIEQNGKQYYVGCKDGAKRSVEGHIRKNNKRMWVNGEYISTTHPLHKPGRYEGFEEAAFSALTNYKTSTKGELYLITNPAFEGWVKVGMAVDARDRLKNYQTSTPFRDFEIQSFCKVNDRRAAEAELHRRLSKIYEQRGEWFKCSVNNARDEMACVKLDMEEL
jgi:hypothetical protein